MNKYPFSLLLLLAPFALAFFFGPTLLFFSACLLIGFGLTYAINLPLHFEERFVFGGLIGALVVTACAFLFSLLFQDVTLLSLSLGLLVPFLLALTVACWQRTQVLTDALAFPSRLPSLWPMVLLTAICSLWILHFFSQAFTYLHGALYSGYINIWGDWAVHLIFAGSFAYGHNFPPQFPIDPGHNLGYPFMADFFAALLVPLGASLPASLVLTSSYLALLFPPLFYLIVARFTSSSLAGFFAVFIFLLSGGLGFAYLLPSLDAHGFRIFSDLPREYTLDRSLNYQWLNPTLAYLIPQRSSLFGFSLFLLVLGLLYLALQRHTTWPTFAVLGILVGLSPTFHAHAYASIIALSFFWAIFNRRKAWLAFFLPALFLGLPTLAWLWPTTNTACGFHFPLCYQLGWLSANDWKRDGLSWFLPDFIWFWVKNTSLFLPILLLAHYLPRFFPPTLIRYFAPLWLWFAIPNLFTLQPWDWDNTKFFIFFLLFGSILVGLFLARLATHSTVGAVFAALLFFVLVFAGSLDLTRASFLDHNSNQVVDAKGVVLAEWVRANTPPDAIFVTADDSHSPIPLLAGRTVLTGYPGWTWSYGLSDWLQKDNDDHAILRGASSTPELIAKYHISYILIGPTELSGSQPANVDYWNNHGTVFYKDGEYTLYHIP